MPDKKRKKKKPDDIMHGRSFEGVQWASTERSQTEERRARPVEEEGDDFVTDAEIEARRLRSRDDTE
ncbi:MAG TPA: hypothetical protein VIP11_18550 [Gemmatimonadaceae bacterium]